jgi:hypothetical protein
MCTVDVYLLLAGLNFIHVSYRMHLCSFHSLPHTVTCLFNIFNLALQNSKITCSLPCLTY